MGVDVFSFCNDQTCRGKDLNGILQKIRNEREMRWGLKLDAWNVGMGENALGYKDAENDKWMHDKGVFVYSVFVLKFVF